MLQSAAEGRIDDGGLPAPLAQDVPDDVADVVHVHLLYDPTRLDLLFKSIAQSIKFIGRFGDKQWRLRQKCQFVSSTHLTRSSELTRGPGQRLTRRARWPARSANHSPSLSD